MTVSSKPETVFTNSVNKYLRGVVYFEKMNNPFRAGTADFWYSGKKGDLWIEYKYIPKIPTRTTILPDLSARQLKWLNDREAEGRSVEVIVGHPDGGVVWPCSFEQPLAPEVFRNYTRSRKALADLIKEMTGESPCLSPNSSSLSFASYR